MVGGTAGLREHGMLEAQASEIERSDKGVEEADGVILGNVVIQGFREEGNLVSIDSLDVIHVDSAWTNGVA